MVITGDVTQVDLPASRHSGLIEVQAILKGVPGITFVYFDEHDVVRHRLVSAIIRAYGAHEARVPARPVADAPPARDDETTATAC
jgi:phosphate starvation-inducible protein PhoH and related proteins